MKKCPSVSVFWRQWHRGDGKFKTMVLKGCSNFQWHIGDELHFSVAYREFTPLLIVRRSWLRRGGEGQTHLWFLTPFYFVCRLALHCVSAKINGWWFIGCGSEHERHPDDPETQKGRKKMPWGLAQLAVSRGRFRAGKRAGGQSSRGLGSLRILTTTFSKKKISHVWCTK